RDRHRSRQSRSHTSNSQFEAPDQILKLLRQPRELFAGIGGLGRAAGVLFRRVADVGDVAVDLLGHRALLLGRTGDLGGEVVDRLNRLLDGLDRIAGIVGALDVALGAFTHGVHHLYRL